MSARSVTLILSTVTCCICLGGCAATTSHGPKTSQSVPAKNQAEVPVPDSILAWDAAVKEYIAGPKESEAFFTFNVTNVSSANVTVSGVTTSCGCTVARLPSVPWIIPPGANGQLHATMKLAGLNGVIMKSLTVNTDKGQKLLFVRVNAPIPANP